MPSQEHEGAVAYWQAYLGSLDSETDLVGMRQGYESTMVAAAQPPDDLRIEERRLEHCSLFWFSVPESRQDRVILFFHGGGYMLGSTRSCSEFLGRVARACRAVVVSVDYRLAPEFPFPAAVEDGVAAYQHLNSQCGSSTQIAFAGESAGGGLALATAIASRAKGFRAMKSIVCFSPWVDLEIRGSTSQPGVADDPTVSVEVLQLMQSQYAPDDPADQLASPLNADLSGMPPLFLAAGTREILYDDAARLANAAKTAGVSVQFEAGEGLAHIWPLIAPNAPESDSILQKMAVFLESNWTQ